MSSNDFSEELVAEIRRMQLEAPANEPAAALQVAECEITMFMVLHDFSVLAGLDRDHMTPQEMLEAENWDKVFPGYPTESFEE